MSIDMANPARFPRGKSCARKAPREGPARPRRTGFLTTLAPAPAAATAYRTLLPTLATEKMSENAVFLHADPLARPYGIDDIVAAISAKADLKTITNLAQQTTKVHKISRNGHNIRCHFSTFM
ncbi:hypothetical protein HPB48_022934 [Haemaphysalis longicornis]|uniref:Uncharacterized protein n=1 Tax=Haemaphysalis longicornis TaxID=44386 RepID=A0A9J6GH82_HAELO|nr:hypothetical protein HPB48_022934 [Haemaphysalis longicornis]